MPLTSTLDRRMLWALVASEDPGERWLLAELLEQGARPRDPQPVARRGSDDGLVLDLLDCA